MNRDRPVVKIAGAGPSGLIAAICLARSGMTVEVFEAQKAVGARFIGDFQVIENTSFKEDARDMLKRMSIDINFFFKPIHQAVFYDHRLKPQCVQSDRPYGYFIQRGSEGETLDRGLLSQALSVGVKIHFGCRVTPEDVDIVATGPAVADGLAKEMTFSTDLPETISVLFDMNVSPGGYSYLFVVEGRATFGCAITRDFDGIKNYFELALKRFQSIQSFEMNDPKFAYSYMNFCLKSSAMAHEKPFVGEAGGFQDYLFGLGIRYAIKTGFAGAESILKNVSYDKLWQQEIGSAQEVSLVNRSLYEIGGNLGLSSFVKRAGRGDLQHYLAKWHKQTAWKKLLLPFVKQYWEKESSCFHRLPEHWCREKPKASAKTELGPLKENRQASQNTAPK